MDVPNHCGFILLTNPAEVPEALDLSAREPVRLYSKTGTRLGRENVWWVLNDSAEQRRKTLIAGISPEDGDNTEFFTTERSLEILRGGAGRLRFIDNILESLYVRAQPAMSPSNGLRTCQGGNCKDHVQS